MKREKEIGAPFVLNQTKVNIMAPAKLNLTLRITGKRDDGYHEIESIFVPVSLYDTLKIEKIGKGLDLNCIGRRLPENNDNIVERAALCFFEKTGIKKKAKITLNKKIPISSGLGGGSSDAAAVLKGLNRLWGYPLSKNDVNQIALSLGADVPFFLLQRPAIATGIGEILEPIRSFPDYWYVIVSPKLMVSTAWVYKNSKFVLTRTKKKDINKISKKYIFNIQDILFNDLEKVTLKRYPFLKLIKASLVDSGACGALMSGSGASIFGIFYSLKRAYEASGVIDSFEGRDVFVVRGMV